MILSSVLKNVGDSLVRMAEMEEEGTVPYGKCEFLGLKENGAGLADNEYFQKNVPDEIKKDNRGEEAGSSRRKDRDPDCSRRC